MKNKNMTNRIESLKIIREQYCKESMAKKFENLQGGQ